MHNPCRGVVTSEHFDDGGYRHHKGRDIGTREVDANGKPVWVYGVGKPVYAAFGGWWKKIVRWSKPGNLKSTWAKDRTGNGGLVANPDGEGQGYNHVLILDHWDEGDWINEGELIGYLDRSGNMSAPHLHFETWSDWKNPDSDFSPKILFRKYGVDTMTDPSPQLTIDLAGIVTSKPASVGNQANEGELTVSQYEELKADIAALSKKIDTILNSTSGKHIDDFVRGDQTTVAGALERLLTLTRRLEQGKGCKFELPAEPPVEPGATEPKEGEA